MLKDEFSYLEDITDERTRSWIKTENDRTISSLERSPRFRRYLESALKSLDESGADLKAATFRLSLRDGWIYELSSGSVHPRGIWRRTRLDSYLASKPEWQTLLDLDALAAREGRSWTLARGADIDFSPSGTRCLLVLSDGGSQTFELREFDVERADFVEDGFVVPAARNPSATWRDNNTVVVATDFGTASSKNREGLPIVVKEWSRGQSLSQARELFRGEPDDYAVMIVPGRDTATPAKRRVAQYKRRVVISRISHDTLQTWWWQIDTTGRVGLMNLPASAYFGIFTGAASEERYIFAVDKDWTTGGRTWKAGSVLSILASELARPIPTVEAVREVRGDESLIDGGLVPTRNGVVGIGSLLGSSFMWTASPIRGHWRYHRVPLPANGMIRACMSDAQDVFVLYEDFLQSPTLYQFNAKRNLAAGVIRSPSEFESDPFLTEQVEAKSTDGTSVPYFIVRPRHMRYDGQWPVLVTGYGAAGGSLKPAYHPEVGKLWLEQGGIYVAANIRGGQERGEAWHVTGIHRQRTYDDMAAIVRDLIKRGITEPKRIGVMGYSAGGLVAGVMLTQYPGLLGAAILRAPKLDNFRYDLSVGTSDYQKREYGSPDKPDERAFLERTSPFQNLRRSPEFPAPLILTATNDENVRPAQARRFAAKAESLQLPFFFYEAPDGGHSGSGPGVPAARLNALMYTYLARALIDERPRRK